MNRKLIKVEAETDFFRNIFFVDWSVGNTCNYKCSYCPPVLHAGNFRWLGFDDFVRFCDVLLPQIPEGKNIMFSFTGGETTMWPDFLRCCQYLKSQDRPIRINFLSNGSRSLSWWEKSLPYYDRVLLSYHYEHTSKEHFIKVADLLKAGKNVVAHFLMEPDFFKELLDIAIEVYEATGIRVSLQPVMGDLADVHSAVRTYTENERNIMAEQYRQYFTESIHDDYKGRMNLLYDDGSAELITSAEIHALSRNRWYGCQCNIGLDHLAINNEGLVSRGWCLQGGILGTIWQRNFRLPRHMIRCEKEYCNNLADMVSLKYL